MTVDKSNSDSGTQRGIWSKLSKTRGKLKARIDSAITGRKTVDPLLLEEIEEILFTSDIGIETTEQLVDEVKSRLNGKSLDGPKQLKSILRDKIVSLFDNCHGIPTQDVYEDSDRTLRVNMFTGVNGVGKTTTMAKMAYYYQNQGQKVIMVAADTFRAAAIEQLRVWGGRAGIDVISQKRGADPAAVVFDALSSAMARGVERVLIDTAGRLHTKSNLMDELKKIKRVIDQQIPGQPERVILVLDATTGQNAIIQTQTFVESLGITDIILTKLDGTAKGGAVIDICHKLGIPISFIGTGEGLEDFHSFNPVEFVESILY